jgi:hypothetical protein
MRLRGRTRFQRNKDIFAFNATDISATVSGKENHRLAKGGNPETWSVAAPAGQTALKVEKEKVDALISSVAAVRALGYAPDYSSCIKRA